MIQFAPTTKKGIRFGSNVPTQDKTAHLDRLRQGLADIDANTQLVDVNTVSRAPLSMDGIMSEYKFTREGFASLCSKLSPNSFGLLQGIESADMGVEAKTTLQTEIFNKLWNARSHELDGCNFLVDSRSNKVEAVHSKTYGYLSNHTALEMLLEQFDADNSLTYYKLHGRTIDVGLEDPTKKYRLPTRRKPEGEDISGFRYLNNSEDGSSKFSIGHGMLVWICSNGMKILDKQQSICSAYHKSSIIENIRYQLRQNSDIDYGRIFQLMENSTKILFTDEIRAKAYSFLKDNIGTNLAKKFTSDEVSMTKGEIPSLYCCHASVTEEAHKGPYSVRQQSEMEDTGYRLLQKFAA